MKNMIRRAAGAVLALALLLTAAMLPGQNAKAADPGGEITVYGNGGTYTPAGGSEYVIQVIEDCFDPASYIPPYQFAEDFIRPGFIPVSLNTKANGSGVSFPLDVCLGGSVLRELLDAEQSLYMQWEAAPSGKYYVFYGTGGKKSGKGHLVKTVGSTFTFPSAGEFTSSVSASQGLKLLGWTPLVTDVVTASSVGAGQNGAEYNRAAAPTEAGYAPGARVSGNSFPSGTKFYAYWGHRSLHVYLPELNDAGKVVHRDVFTMYDCDNYYLSGAFMAGKYGSGYTLEGWSTQPDGSGNIYLNEPWLRDIPTSITALYGQILYQSSRVPVDASGLEPEPDPDPEPDPEPSPSPSPRPTPNPNPNPNPNPDPTPAPDDQTTVIDWPDGRKTTTTVDGQGYRTITVTDASGETVLRAEPSRVTGSPKAFTDVAEDDWFRKNVDKTTSMGLFFGVSDTEFGPYEALDRSMLVGVLYRLSGSPAYGTGNRFFSDVPADAWYLNAADWGFSAGIVYGTSDSVYSPTQPLSRQDMVTMFYRYAVLAGKAPKPTGSLDAFTDRELVQDYAMDAMQWAVGEKIIYGRTETALEPYGTAQRCEIAAVLARFVDYLAR